MHRNYRRKNGKHNPKKGAGGSWQPYSLVEYRREYWQWVRARVKTLMYRERYELIQNKHRPSILWDWW